MISIDQKIRSSAFRINTPLKILFLFNYKILIWWPDISTLNRPVHLVVVSQKWTVLLVTIRWSYMPDLVSKFRCRNR